MISSFGAANWFTPTGIGARGVSNTNSGGDAWEVARTVKLSIGVNGACNLQPPRPASASPHRLALY